MLSNLRYILVFLFGLFLAAAMPAGVRAEEHPRARPLRSLRNTTALDRLSVFNSNFPADGLFSVTDVSGKAVNAEILKGTKKTLPATEDKVVAASDAHTRDAAKAQGKSDSLPPPSVADQNTARAALNIPSPDEDPKVRVDPNAPVPFIGLVSAYQDGDMPLASRYADQWVRYQQNFMFTVRDLTQIIGQALIRQEVIDEDSWNGVGQFIDYNFAKTREETGALFKPKKSKALELVTPDSKNEVEIYYLFSMDCSWCRYMAPDVERLWRSVKGDPKVKMVGLMMSAVPQDWLQEYREYTELSLPVYDGSEIAKAFHVRFVPAVVIVTKNDRKGFLKTGQQSFADLYEFVRRAQGLPASRTAEIEKLLATPIGEVEKLKSASAVREPNRADGKLLPVNIKSESRDILGRF